MVGDEEKRGEDGPGELPLSSQEPSHPSKGVPEGPGLLQRSSPHREEDEDDEEEESRPAEVLLGALKLFGEGCAHGEGGVLFPSLIAQCSWGK